MRNGEQAHGHVHGHLRRSTDSTSVEFEETSSASMSYGVTEDSNHAITPRHLSTQRVGQKEVSRRTSFHVSDACSPKGLTWIIRVWPCKLCGRAA